MMRLRKWEHIQIAKIFQDRKHMKSRTIRFYEMTQMLTCSMNRWVLTVPITMEMSQRRTTHKQDWMIRKTSTALKRMVKRTSWERKAKKKQKLPSKLHSRAPRNQQELAPRHKSPKLTCTQRCPQHALMENNL